MTARGLGRGFDSLIPTELVDDEFDPTSEVDEKISKLQEIALDDIEADADQPRRSFKTDQIEALANSIKEHGVLQPIVVTKSGKKYKIVAGERRWRASKIAGLAKIPVIVRSLSDQNRLELSLIENVQREDLNAIETATAYAKLKTQFNMTTAEVAKRVGKSESAVINTMRLLSLPEEAKRMMVEKGLSEGQLRPLITASPEMIAKVLPKIAKEGWSARKVEQYMVTAKIEAKKSKISYNSDYEEDAKRLTEQLGMKVKVRVSARGSGDIMIRFKNEKELNKICTILTA
ncbi:MAG: ParB/RepB/Spo0J family partition protein [Candidatus Nomurabacteria bacterium]|jgi:ParB family chromosome partitioning protein|nr:ParB/RepB/Spo0J family partition protein [Candidatus Nomurabacteria bacterium]